MRIIMVRSLKGYPDSRVEKELYSLSKENQVSFFGWNRSGVGNTISQETVDVFGRPIEYYHFNKMAPIGLGFKKLFFSLLKYWKAEYKFLKKNADKYDAIHACDFDTVLPALYIAKKYKKKLVYDIFDYYSESHNAPKIIKKIIKKIEDYVIGKSDVTIICSDKRREQIKDSNPNKLYIIHNTPMDMLKKNNIEKDMLTKDKIKMAYIGLLSEDRYLKEIASVVKNMKNLVWIVGGWGPLDSYFLDLSRKYNNIIYHGEVSYEKALELESKCDIMTALYDPNIPNHKYAAPNKFYESLMLGKPLIMIKGTGMDDYVSKYEIGQVIDLNKIDFCTGLGNAITKIINDNNVNEIGIKSRKIYEKEFSWAKMEERLLDVYRTLE